MTFLIQKMETLLETVCLMGAELVFIQLEMKTSIWTPLQAILIRGCNSAVL